MKPRQIVHTLLLISESILFSSLLVLSIIGCVKKIQINMKLYGFPQKY